MRASGQTIVKKPKSDAGIRDVAVPPHLLPLVREHLLQHAEPGKDGLLFPAQSGGHLAPSSLYRVCTRPGRRPGDRISASTTCGTPAPSWPRAPARRWPS